jgi:hypothetical protein
MKKNLLGIPLSAEGIFRLSSKRAMKQGKVTEKGENQVYYLTASITV